jgi:hypothetical protein
LSDRHHLLSWVLSTQTAMQWYPDTVLYTDEAGAALLVDCLGLKFGQVSTALDAMAPTDPDMQGAGKLYAYSLQAEPFVHIDSDVYLWSPLPARLTRAPLLSQNPEPFELGASHYHPEAFEEAGWVPEEWKWFYTQTETVQRGDWCGIFGGNAIDLINHYACLALRMVEHAANRPTWSRLIDTAGAGDAFGLVEEYLLSACLEYHRRHEDAGERDVHMEYLFASVAEAYGRTVPARSGYTHLIGVSKRNPVLCRRLELRVSQEYPELFARCAECAGRLGH